MHPALQPSAFVTLVVLAVLWLLVGTITGRYVLRRLAIVAAVVAACAVVVLDGHSPL